MIEISYGGKYEENNYIRVDQPDDAGSNQRLRKDRYKGFQYIKSHMDVF